AQLHAVDARHCSRTARSDHELVPSRRERRDVRTRRTTSSKRTRAPRRLATRREVPDREPQLALTRHLPVVVLYGGGVAVAALVIFASYVALASLRPLLVTRVRAGYWALRGAPGRGRFVGLLVSASWGVVWWGAILDLNGQ